MLDDFINMTQGQLLIHYWWLWLSIVGVGVIYIIFFGTKRK